MRLLLAIGLALAASIPALATPQDPVRNVLAAASHDWRQDITENEDYFSDARVRTLYSQAFVKSLMEASALASANDDGIFEMDFLINSQTGCPFENIKLDDKLATQGITFVDVHFYAFRCMTNGEDTTRVSHLIFKVIAQDGRDVIDDILRVDDGKEKSIRQEMDGYAKAVTEGAQ